MTDQIKTPTIICPAGAGAYSGREEEFVWRLDTSTNEWLVPSRQQAYIDWALTPKVARVPQKFKEFCERLGVHEQTVYRWKKDKRFKDAMKKAAAEKNYSTEQIQAVVDALWAAATNGDVKAMDLYLRYVKELEPTTRVIVEDADLKSVPTDRLIEMYEEQIAALRNTLPDAVAD